MDADGGVTIRSPSSHRALRGVVVERSNLYSLKGSVIVGIKRKIIKNLALSALAALDRRTERPDGDLMERVHPYRKLMAYIMPTRNGSVVFFDTQVKAAPLLAYLKEANEFFHADITHCLVAAASYGLAENPRMNRFVVGRRLYRRRGHWLTFSMKRKKMDKGAKLATVKIKVPDNETFPQLCKRINDQINVERSDEETYLDKELGLLDRLPRPALEVGVKALKTLDYFNLLPDSFIKGDGMYTSMFIANLGSLGMAPGYHHLYEWGNCPLFMMVGKIEARPVVVDGEVKVEEVIPIRWSFDERIDDGLNASHGIQSVSRALENPYQYFGGLAEGGAGAPPLNPSA